MMADIEKYKGPISGEYNNIKYYLKRENDTNWCGYISIPFEKLDETIQKKVKDSSYYGITKAIVIDKVKYVGFHTCNYQDFYVASVNVNNDKLTELAKQFMQLNIQLNKVSYKDYDYVIKIIYNMIDTYWLVKPI
jgi:hypothetical protein